MLAREADENPDIRALVLTGAGGNFCSGADLKEMAGGHQPDTDSEIDVQARLAEDPDLPWKALLRSWRPHVPIIAAVEGTAIAGGTELLGATEIRVAGRAAKFGISEVRWSLYPMGGSAVRIPRQIPYTIACELLLTGDHITAERALELGLIGHVVDDGGALEKATEIGQRICANGPLAVSSVLKTLPRDQRHAGVRGARTRVHLRLGRLRLRGRQGRPPGLQGEADPQLPGKVATVPGGI